jgi:hypothetical protein
VKKSSLKVKYNSGDMWSRARVQLAICQLEAAGVGDPHGLGSSILRRDERGFEGDRMRWIGAMEAVTKGVEATRVGEGLCVRLAGAARA